MLITKEMILKLIGFKIQDKNEKNKPNGYVGLNEAGQINSELLPEVDLSLYQLKSEKSQTNGYVGLDENGHLTGDLILSNKNKIRWIMLITTAIDSFAYFGQSATTQSTYSNQSPFKSTNSSALFTKTYSLPSNSSNYNASHSNISVTINGNVKINSEILVSFKNSGATTTHTFAVIFGNCYFDNTETLYGDGFVIAYNPTLNSGKLRVGKVVNSVTSFTNLDITLSQSEANLFSCKYNTITNIAELYLNKTLIHTFSSAALTTNTAYKVGVNLASSSTSETLVRRYSIFGGYFEAEIL